ncbi:Phosphotransferase [Maublancomyces gigas]|uniref:Phosphotransferase n=1 Tax=Discina gigas TaxID=1032678 RepID=A0ABR3G7I2_9PEZI
MAGVDAINTTLEVIIFAGAINLGQSWWTLLTLFASSCTFYLTTWEEYHTGTLYLGIVSGPVEGVLTLCTLYALTAITGGSFWQKPMLETLGLPIPDFLPEVLGNMPFNRWYLLYGSILLTFNIFQSSQNVIHARRSKGLTIFPALAGLAPFFITWMTIPIWCYLRPEILGEHILPFIFFIGASFAYQVGLVIVAHLTKSPYPYFNILLLPIFAGTLDALGPFLQERFGKDVFGWPSALGGGPYAIAYVFGCLGLSIGVYGSFVVDVITNICGFLDIWCLTIKHPWDPKEEKSQKSH